jgi:hypothetical protein
MPVAARVNRFGLHRLLGVLVVAVPIVVLTLYATGALSAAMAIVGLVVVAAGALLARSDGALLVVAAAALLTLHELAFSDAAPQWAQGVALIVLVLIFLARSPSAPLSRASADARPDRGPPL